MNYTYRATSGKLQHWTTLELVFYYYYTNIRLTEAAVLCKGARYKLCLSLPFSFEILCHHVIGLWVNSELLNTREHKNMINYKEQLT